MAGRGVKRGVKRRALGGHRVTQRARGDGEAGGVIWNLWAGCCSMRTRTCFSMAALAFAAAQGTYGPSDKVDLFANRSGLSQTQTRSTLFSVFHSVHRMTWRSAARLWDPC